MNYYNFLIGIILILIVTATAFAVKQGRSLLLRTAAPIILIELIFYFIYVKLFLYYFIPAIFRIFSGFQFEYQDGVTPIELLVIYGIEFISWIVWLMVFCIVIYFFSRYKEKESPENFLKKNFSIAKNGVVVIAFGFIYILAIGILRLEVHPFLEIFKSVFYFSGMAVGPLLVMLSSRFFNKKFLFFGFFLCLSNALTISTRGAIVYMVLFFYYLAWVVVKDRAAKKTLLIITMLLVGLYFILGGLVSGSVTVNETGEMKFDFGANAEKNEGRSAMQEIEWRFGASTRMGTAFIRLYDKGEGAGILPIKHSLMGILPRSIDPEKPIPSTTVPDDIFSQGMYVISREINGYDSYSMTEFPTGGHFYWEFGIIGVLVLSVISALYVSFCVMYFSRFGLFSILIIIAIFKPWGYMDPKIWVSELVLQVYQIILPAIFILTLIKWFKILKNLIVQVLYLSK